MVNIWFGELRIKSVSSSSGIFAGSNLEHKIKHTSKNNQAFGTVKGERCLVVDSAAWLQDADHVDMETNRKRNNREKSV
jgi:hypothetical protein